MTMISTIICGLGIAAVIFTLGVIVGLKVVDRIDNEERRH